MKLFAQVLTIAAASLLLIHPAGAQRSVESTTEVYRSGPAMVHHHHRTIIRHRTVVGNHYTEETHVVARRGRHHRTVTRTMVRHGVSPSGRRWTHTVTTTTRTRRHHPMIHDVPVTPDDTAPR